MGLFWGGAQRTGAVMRQPASASPSSIAVASAWFHLGNYPEALPPLEAALALDPAFLRARYTLALAREVPVSRGELVEIGGSFRIPEVMQRAGCRLVEVGATEQIFTNPQHRLTEDYITGRFG